jgi:predicted DNA-binding transcriptional regulator YafY
LVHRWGWWYVVGFCHVRGEVRTFRVDRIAALTLSDSTFHIPAEFDLHVHLKNEFANQPQVKVKLKFGAESIHLATFNRSYWESLEDQADGSVVVTFSAPSLEWAASSALAYGTVVEALEPPDLRRMMAEWTQVIQKKYS